MVAPPPSKLDQRQILQGVYDEENGRLRTSAEATIVNADIDVSLDSTEDNVAIRSSTGVELKINSNGSLDTNTLNGNLESTQSLVLAELDSQTSQNTQIITELQTLNTSTDNIESDVDNIRIATQALNTKTTNNYGASTGAIRTAAQIGNSTGTADFNTGASSAQTLRTASNLYKSDGSSITDVNYLPIGQSTHDNLNINANIQFNNLDVSESRPLPVEQTFNNINIYGDQIVSNLTPIILGNAVYGFVPSNFRTYMSGTGSSVITNNVFSIFSGTNTSDFGSIQSFRSLSYRAGFGCVARLSGRFVSPNINTISGIGVLTIGDELSFGYNGTEFGIWHRYYGAPEVRTLTITKPAAGAENATLILNGTIFTIPLTAGTTVFNAYQIANYIATNSTLFYAEQNGSTVTISVNSDGEKNGTYSFTSSTAVGSFVRTKAGATKQSTHIPKTSWNGVQISIDPTKGNLYQIIYENGYSDIRFYIQESNTGKFVLVHTLPWNNTKTILNMLNPNLHMGAYCSSINSNPGSYVEVSHFAGFLAGKDEKTRNPRAYSSTKLVAKTPTVIMSIRNKRIFNGFQNQAEITPVYVTLANDGGKTAVFNIYSGGTLNSTQNYLSIGNNLISEIDIESTTLTGGILLASFAVAKGQSIEVNLSEFDIKIPPTLTMNIVGYMTSGTASDLSASLTWYEDV